VTQGQQQPIFLRIRGKRPLAENEFSRTQVLEWRKFLVREITSRYAKIRDLASTVQLTVDIIFVFTKQNAKGVDLDNLAKPVLDTLFKPRKNKDKQPDYDISSALFEIEDSTIFDLRLRKVGLAVEKQIGEGIDILITWS
jgi:Holliday junction resolvase RusA-like endonuclease